MALIAVVASLAGLATDVSKLYKQEGNVFVLDVTPAEGYALENITGLKSTLGKEMNARKEAEKKLEDFAGLDPTAARTALEKVEKMKDWKPEDKIKEQLALQVAEVQSKFDAEKKKIAGENEFLTKQLNTALITNVATAAITANKGVPELLMPHIASRTRVVREGDRLVVQVLNDAGNPDTDIVNGQVVPKTVDSLVTAMRNDKIFGRAFEPNGSSGAGSGGNSGNGGGGGSPKTGADGILRISRNDTAAISANMEKIADGTAEVVD